MLIQKLIQNNPILEVQLQQAKSEFKSNKRLRTGFWLVIFIVLVYTGLEISESRTDISQRLSSAKLRESKAIHLAKEIEWLERSQQLEQTLYHLQLEFNAASTEGTAKATLQGLMNTIVSESGIDNPNIRVEQAESPTITLPLWSYVTTISAQFDQNSLNDLLFSLSSHPYHLTVEELDIEPARNRFSMKVKYWFANEHDLAMIRSKSEQLPRLKKSSRKRGSLADDNAKTKHSPENPKALTKEQIEELKKQGFPDEIFN